MTTNRHIIAAALTLAMSAGAAVAQTVDEAKQWMADGDYAAALPVMQKALKAKPRDASLNQWVGVCLLRTGQPAQAERYLAVADERKVLEAPRYLAEAAFEQYRFAEVGELLDRYESAIDKANARKAKKAAKIQKSPQADDLRRRASLAKSMLDRVEKIVVIDSMAVDREAFFERYHLSPESGAISGVDVLPGHIKAAEPSTVYTPQSGDFRIWAALDAQDNIALTSATRLIDGSWDEPSTLGSALSAGGGDSNYPFMMPDGVTLYYANNGPESIGGYDIFLSRRDENGFLQPQNVGMPYNSPADDYLLAIDEVNGVGWWATDRNHLGDLITIYRFIPSELRVNYAADSEGLAAAARIDSYRATWPAAADYAELLRRIDDADYTTRAAEGHFYFAMPGNRVITRWEELHTPASRAAMEDYLDANQQLQATLATLADLRRRYAGGERALASRITALEQQELNQRQQLRQLSNKVVAADGQAR